MSHKKIQIKTETGKCLLCHDAPCSKACKNNVPVSEIIRSLRFENAAGASKKTGFVNRCASCMDPLCMKACNRSKIDCAVDIQSVLSHVKPCEMEEDSIPDLGIDSCGIHFENPFLLSSSIVGSNYEMIAKAFDMGWGGVAFKTIGMFVPEEASPRFDALEKENNPMIGFKNIEQISDHTLEENMEYIRRLKKDYKSKVIIASIMGQNEEEWTYLACKLQEAGADMIECNFSCPHMSGNGLGSDVGTNAELVRIYTEATRRGTKLPILAKMTPNITNMEIPAIAAIEGGANGIAAINTVKSVMNVNLQTFASGPDVMGKSSVGGYSGKAIKPIALRFIHDLKSSEALRKVPVSGMGGIETWKDAAEFFALGCETVQVTTAVMQYGYRIIDDLKEGLGEYMQKEGYQNLSDMVGKAIPNLLPAEKLNRQTIGYPKFNREHCVACGRCYLSCFDGGHQAITRNAQGKPTMDGKKCVGCQLCRVVCPAGAISSGTRVEI